MVRGRDQQIKLDLRFCDIKECKTLSNKDKRVLRAWRVSNSNEFGKSKKRALHARNSRKSNQHKHQKRKIQ